MSTKKQSPMTEKESVRWRVANAHIDPDNYVFFPAKNRSIIMTMIFHKGLRFMFECLQTAPSKRCLMNCRKSITRNLWSGILAGHW